MIQGLSGSSVQGRVVRATVLSAAVAALVAAVLVIVAVDVLIAGHNDQRLRAATDVLAGELDELREEADHESLEDVLLDENQEILTSGIRLAVYSGGQVIAGDAWARRSPAGACETFGALAERQRSCGKTYGHWTLVAAQVQDDEILASRYWLACVGAVLVAILLAGTLGRRLGVWSISPLQRLSFQVDALDAQALETLKPPEGGKAREVEKVYVALNELIERTRTLLKKSQRFAADAAHELRTPLTKLAVQLELLGEATHDDNRGKINAAIEHAQGLAYLVDRLLLLASPAEELARGFEPVALDEVVEEAIDALKGAAIPRITFALGDEGLVRGDPLLLRTLVANGLTNALKFSSGAVTLTLKTVAGTHVLQIQDHGPGIPPSLRGRVFDAFYRLRADQTPGHGLGLALMAHIAMVHDAQLAFVDSPGASGACLEFRIPALPIPDSQELP